MEIYQNNQLEELIKEVIANKHEGQTLEVKAANQGTPTLFDTISSFSNQDEGGVIIFGIDENAEYKPVGVFDAQQLQIDVTNQCAQMQPVVQPHFQETVFEGNTIVAAYIPAVSMGLRPVYRIAAGIQKGSYYRAGESDRRMGAAQLYEYDAFKNGIHHDIATVDAVSTDVLNEDLVNNFVARAREGRPNLAPRSKQEVLRLTNAMKGEAPTLAGLLVLSDYPQQAFPNLCITAVAVANTHISSTDAGERFLDNKRFEGSIGEMLEGVLGFIRRNTKTTTVIKDATRSDVSEYPEEAVREIIINALMHRDYGPYSNGTPVRLVLYSDRLECWNPGGIYGSDSVEELGYENIQTRNPSLVSLLEIIGLVENRHSGIPIMRDAMAARGLPAPEFDVRNGFRVTLRNELQPAVVSKTGADRRMGITEKAILDFCSEPRTRAELAAQFGRGAAYLMKVYIAPLVEEGKLVLEMPDKPKSKFQRYVRR